MGDSLGASEVLRRFFKEASFGSIGKGSVGGAGLF